MKFGHLERGPITPRSWGLMITMVIIPLKWDDLSPRIRQDLRTGHGSSLAQCVKPGIDNKGAPLEGVEQGGCTGRMEQPRTWGM